MTRAGVVSTAPLAFILAAMMDASAIGGQARDDARPPVPWSATPVSWSDYLGRPQPGGGASAATVYRLAYEEACTDAGFDFRVQVLLEPTRSWVVPGVLLNPTNSRKLLEHEQGHFDLAEVEARRLRRALAQQTDPCARPQADRRAIVLRHLQADAETQARYDRDTNHGIHELRQGRWRNDIVDLLKSLSEFSDTPSPVPPSIPAVR